MYQWLDLLALGVTVSRYFSFPHKSLNKNWVSKNLNVKCLIMRFCTSPCSSAVSKCAKIYGDRVSAYENTYKSHEHYFANFGEAFEWGVFVTKTPHQWCLVVRHVFKIDLGQWLQSQTGIKPLPQTQYLSWSNYQWLLLKHLIHKMITDQANLWNSDTWILIWLGKDSATSPTKMISQSKQAFSLAHLSLITIRPSWMNVCWI